MVYKGNMSTVLRIFFVLFLFSLSHSAVAQGMSKEQLASEVVYRVNLGRADDVKLLLDQGASADQTDDNGVPILALASSRTDEEGASVMGVLLKAGANVNLQDPQGKTALFYAAKKGNATAVKLLLDNKINYYAIDNRGDIARTVAFREGHNHIVDTLDAFVHEQTIKVNQEYEKAKEELTKRYEEQRLQAEERNRKLIEVQQKMIDQQKEMAEAEQKRQEEIAAKEAELKKKSKEMQEAQKAAANEQLKKMKEEAAIEEAKAAEEKRKKALEDEKKAIEESQRLTKELLARSQELAMHSCALEYWYYCREAKQPTEMDENELNQAIETEKDNLLEMKTLVAALNPNPADFPENLAARSKKMIFDQLDGIPSRRMRRDEGVGTLEDMRRRCSEISQQWQIVSYNNREIKNIDGPGGGQGGSVITPSPVIGTER